MPIVTAKIARDNDERRRHLRYAVQLQCWLESDEATVFGPTADVALGGVFLRTAVPLVEGQRVRVALTIERKGKTITGDRRRHRHACGARAARPAPRRGVEFLTSSTAATACDVSRRLNAAFAEWPGAGSGVSGEVGAGASSARPDRSNLRSRRRVMAIDKAAMVRGRFRAASPATCSRRTPRSSRNSPRRARSSTRACRWGQLVPESCAYRRRAHGCGARSARPIPASSGRTNPSLEGQRSRLPCPRRRAT